jgi:hypothetical protein
MNSDFLQVISTITPYAILLIVVFVGYPLLSRFLRAREFEMQHRLDIERARLQREEDASVTPSPATPVVDVSGYIVLNLPENQKAAFLDLLRGFEDYAALKGYRISFSYDGSIPDHIAFRFTILEGGIVVTSDRVRQDLQEYMRRVQNGDDFGDLDIVVPPEQHFTRLMILKNRLAFLQQTYATQRNAMQLYQRIVENIGAGPMGQGPQIFIQGTGSIASDHYSAVNSQQIAQGRHIRLIGNTASQSLNLGTTLNERKEIADSLDRIWGLLLSERGEQGRHASEASRYVLKAKDEICDEPEPDESRVRRYLERARDIFSTAAFAKETVDAFKALLTAIGLS